MHKNPFQNTNPRDRYGYPPFHPIQKDPSQEIAPQISARLRLLQKILDEISHCNLPAKSHFEDYMRQRYRRNCKPNTMRSAATGLKQFLSFYNRSGKHHIEQLSREDIEAFTESLQDRGLMATTVSTRLRTVYAFVRFLIENKVLDYELLERRIRIKLPDRLPRAIGPEDLKGLLSVIDKVRDRALILLLLRTGMRIGELLNTRVDDVDLSNRRILIYEADKTGAGRVVYYSEDAQSALMSWLKVRITDNQYLFYGLGNGPLSYESARGIFIRYLEKAGLGYSGYTLHCLRHTFATELLNARIPLECLRVLLGHTSLEVTRIYARLTDKTREQEYFIAMERILRGEPDANDTCDN